MPKTIETDICIIGAGSGGLSVAAGAVQMGARTVLIEKDKMGGDCLNYGCVPSKALIAAGHVAQNQRDGAPFGIKAHEPDIDFAAVNSHVHAVIDGIAPHDSVERFEGLGVTVLKGAGRFSGAREVTVSGDATGDKAQEDICVKAKWFVVSTGSHAGVPPIPGLAETPYLTNETIFGLREAPTHLIVVGGGPIGIELAQAHRRLGCKVTVLEMVNIMGKDDPELVDIVRQKVTAEGVTIREGVKISKVAATNSSGDAGVSVTLAPKDSETASDAEVITGSHLLIAAGRIPNIQTLDLDKAGIDHDRRGIKVDAGLRSSNKRVFAIGDVARGPQFTHVAGYHASVFIRRALFRLFWSKTDYRALPWVTYTDPELANVGLTEEAARKAHGDSIQTLHWSFAENDRARAERATDGLIKVVLDRKGRILGAGIAGRQAGELIQPWILAIQNKMKIGKMTGYIAPYPTLGEVSKRVAGSYYTPSLFSQKTRRLIRFLLRFA